MAIVRSIPMGVRRKEVLTQAASMSHVSCVPGPLNIAVTLTEPPDQWDNQRVNGDYADVGIIS